MRICDHLDLSLLSCVHSFNLDAPNSKSIEEMADELLSETYYWLNKKVIRVNQFETVVTSYRDFSARSFTSTLEKISSIAKALFGFFPGIFLKTCFWILNFNSILERNRKILSHLKKEQNRSNQEIPSYLTYNKGFETPSLYQTSSFFRMGPDLTKIFISYLKNEDLMPLMLSSNQTYEIVANHCASSDYLSRQYHPIIVNALGIELLKNIPCSTLPKAWDKIIAQTNKEYNTIDPTKVRTEENRKKYFNERLNIWAGSYLSRKCYKLDPLNFIYHGCPIQKIQLSEGPALAFQIKTNLDEDYYKFQYYVLAMSPNGVKIFTEVPELTSLGLWALLHDMRYHADEDCLQLQDYLKRLFNGEACGKIKCRFGGDLKFNNKLSGTLNEGSHYCDDGVTPVIQLWPPITIR